ncbi:MAG: hypothetical protein HZB91_02160 [Elusimicrobia bacterium]|nr:hypothetical protein [Elusimicrobiota bacterium]
MNRGVLIAGSLAGLAILTGWLAGRMPATAVSRDPAPTAEDVVKLRTLSMILLSRNDNDPRLDKDFNELSPGAKALFRGMYGKLPPERRNERGTIVYLLGRNLASAEDWAFLASVAGEPPCLSLADCSKDAPAAEEHLGDEVTLAYPSLVALKSAEAALAAGDARTRAKARSVVAAGRTSKMPAVLRLSGRLEAELGASR